MVAVMDSHHGWLSSGSIFSSAVASKNVTALLWKNDDLLITNTQFNSTIYKLAYGKFFCLGNKIGSQDSFKLVTGNGTHKM